ncbi:MAG: HD domain-containing protein [Lachnospiraceae bacterium]|nr:HD domain-containing protein [Lachnospiraceae bacterium]
MFEQLKKKKNLVALFICVGGIALNLFLGFLVSQLGVPLYLDTVGTVAIASIGGFLPGVIVGFFTNIFKSVFDPSSIYYGALNVMIAIVTALAARRGLFKKPKGIFLMIAVLTLIGGGLGTLVPLFMQELTFDSESLSGMLYETGIRSSFWSHFLANLLMDLPDKAITVFFAFLMQRFLPKKFHPWFRFTGWQQTPLPEEEEYTSHKTQVRFLSLRSKISIVLGFSLVTVAVVVTVISITVYHKTLVKEHARLAKGIAEIASGVIEGDRVEEFLRKGSDAAGYLDTENRLRSILSSATDITYLYVYQIREDGCHVVFDFDVDEVTGDAVGTVIPIDEGFSDSIQDLLAGKEVEPVITNDEFGHLLTAYQPVYDSSGRCVCYVGADVDMGQLKVMQRSFLTEMISVFLGFFILLVVFVIWMVRYHVILPVNTITECVDDFSKEDDSQEALDEDVRKIRSLNVHTGDEIEKLYRSISEMTLRQTEQVRNIRRLSESTAKMQDGLIITMADMVENRDSDTGAHIQKTAHYVGIIVEGLKRKGYYPEKITPKFISDVVRSAPLHDVGKINISDEVLNKPGKLTSEEYEIMKTHTTHGKKIIEHAISIVEGESYLKEARNMAAYHHERWDGKGYPDGLHGEVIPLSARIMAVADVFDALTSPRVYKPAFSMEKALEILEDGKGTQFDPKCVEVFMESLGEVRQIMQKYNEHQGVDYYGSTPV